MAEKSKSQGGGSSRGAASRAQEKNSSKKPVESKSQQKSSSQSKGPQQSKGQDSGERKFAQRGQQGQEFGFNREEVIETLNNLLIVDHDALGLYERVLQNLDNQNYKSVVEGFRSDHERHIRELTDSIRRLGGEPMSRPSLMGPVGKIVASIASTLMGNKGALQALMQGEQYTTTSYATAPIAAFPDEYRELVVRNSQDEQRHLQWVTETLKNM